MATATEPVVHTHRFSFNLKTLLLIIAGVGILLAPYQWFGGFYLFSASLSLAIVFACMLTYRQAGGVTILVALAAVFISFVIIMASPMVFGHIWCCASFWFSAA